MISKSAHLLILDIEEAILIFHFVVEVDHGGVCILFGVPNGGIWLFMLMLKEIEESLPWELWRCSWSLRAIMLRRAAKLELQ